MGSRNAVGTVKSVTADTLVVTGRSKGKDTSWTFSLDSSTKIRKESRDATIAELKEGDGVQVRYRTEDGKSIAAVVLARTERAAEAKPADKAADKKQSEKTQ